MKNLNELLCRVLGHKWTIQKNKNNPYDKNIKYECSRCGETMIIKKQ
jgi:hypothetical protein